jgi:hypothetical protein
MAVVLAVVVFLVTTGSRHDRRNAAPAWRVRLRRDLYRQALAETLLEA